MALMLIQRPVAAAVAAAVETGPLNFNYDRYVTTAQAGPPFIPVIVEHTSLPDLVLIALFILFWFNISVKMIRKYRPLHEFAVFLEIGNNSERVKLQVATIRHTPDMYTFTARHFLREIRVTGVFNCHVYIHWPALKMTSKVTQTEYIINARHKISTFTAARPRSILQTNYHVLVVTKESHANTYLRLLPH